MSAAVLPLLAQRVRRRLRAKGGVFAFAPTSLDCGLVSKFGGVSLAKIPGRRGMFRPGPHDPTPMARIRSARPSTGSARPRPIDDQRTRF
jgi:hypothetical protein